MVDVYELIGKLPRPKKGFVLPSHRYTGPYNPLEEQLDADDNPLPGQEPFNEVDRASLHHDICYRDGNSKRYCDDVMLNELDKIETKNFREKIDKKLVHTVISMKRKLDQSPLGTDSAGNKKKKKINTDPFESIPIQEKPGMSKKDFAKLHLEQSGSSFDKSINRQNIIQNYINNSNLFKNSERTIPQVKGFKFTSEENAYINAFSNLNTNKINLKPNTESSFLPQQNKLSAIDNGLEALALSMNNPYLMTEQTTRTMQDQSFKDSYIENDENEFLIILNDLKQLYTGSSFSSKINESRSKKLEILTKYFSKYNKNNELQLDNKKCLTYRNINTNVKFSIYVDHFIKYPDEDRSKTFPMYFRELFLDKILKSQTKFRPTVHRPSSVSGKKKKSNKKHRSNVYDKTS